jgi:hypothetical protein
MRKHKDYNPAKGKLLDTKTMEKCVWDMPFNEPLSEADERALGEIRAMLGC